MYTKIVSAEAKVQTVAGGLCCLIGAGAIAYFLFGKVEDADLASRGVRVEGEVVGKDVGDHHSPDEPNSPGHVTYFLRVQYPRPGGTRIGQFQTYRSDYSRLQMGDRVPIVYDPMNPTLARLGNGQDFRSSGMPFTIGLIFLGGGVYVLVQARKMAQDERMPEAPDLDEAIRAAQNRPRG